METYTQFLDRISSFEVPDTCYEGDYVHVNPNLSDKVEADNSFKPFYGDTTVFDLDNATKEKVKEIVDSLYEKVPECFAERLSSDTFHMTLHDLSNSPHLHCISEDMFWNEFKILDVCDDIGKIKKFK